MEPNLFRYIWHHSKAEQLQILLVVVVAQIFYFLSLNIPKTIVNEAIQGDSFPKDAAGRVAEGSTTHFLAIDFQLPGFLGGGRLHLFDGFPLEQIPYLIALSLLFLLMVMINGGFKFQINTQKGRMGERMLRRLRYELFDRVVRFPQSHFRKVKQAEIATMIKDEVEPLGGFIGDAFVQPMFLGGQALTALFFIAIQSFWLGMVAVAVLAVQAVVIPKLRKRVLELGRERQITARQLAGRIAECVDGSTEIHVNATSNYERADIAQRLGRIFKIRFDLYQRKFAVKFLNNLLAQVTPFLFYLIGGYLAITGQMDIGGLVAVIAAYKDLPGPVKELIDWDQQRQDVQIKYEQVVEQFQPEGMLPPALQAPAEGPPQPLTGEIVGGNMTAFEDGGVKLLDGVSLRLPIGGRTALVGPPGGGKEALALVLARLLPLGSGSISIGGRPLDQLPEAVIGTRMAYAGQDAYLFPLSVRDNILYGLKHSPQRPAQYDEEGRKAWEAYLLETRRAGNPEFDPAADWIDYAAAGVTGPRELDQRLAAILGMVELEDDVYGFGLRGTIDPDRRPTIAAGILKARAELHSRLSSDSRLGTLVESFDRDRYVRNMSVAENLMFGTAVDRDFEPDRLAQNVHVRNVLEDLGLTRNFLEMGREIAETMVELFADLPPGHPFFEQFGFIEADDLPEFRLLLSRVGKGGVEAVNAEDRARLLSLPFPYIEARHRLGLIDDAMEERLLAARRAFASTLPPSLAGAVEFYDPGRYNRAATLQDNILFGRLAYGQAQGAERVGRLITEVLDGLGLRAAVIEVGLDFPVGNAGKRLTATQRQKVGLARALIKQADLLIVNDAVAVMDGITQQRLLLRLLKEMDGRGVIWVLNRPALADRFDHVLVLRGGRLVAQGRFEELSRPGGPIGEMLAAE